MTADQDPYYGRPECSNSDLSMINKYWQPFQVIYDIEKAQNFGTLLDCMLTEPARINYFKRTCAGITYSAADFALAEKMKKAFFRDPFCKMLHEHSDMQAVTVQELEMEYAGFQFSLPFRMKADFDAQRKLKIIGDLKTTTAVTLKEFERVVRAFEYNRQAAVYMDMKKSDNFMIIGISKITGQIFKVAIERGDKLYTAGRERYEELGFRYFTLFHNFQIAA